MKNVISIIALAIGLFFSSCEKAPLDVDETYFSENIEMRSVTEAVAVSKVSSSIDAGELTVIFSGFENVDTLEFIESQTLSFSGSNGAVAFSFLVLGAGAEGENFSIVFDASNVDLSGLEIDGTQSIIIVDGTVE